MCERVRMCVFRVYTNVALRNERYTEINREIGAGGGAQRWFKRDIIDWQSDKPSVARGRVQQQFYIFISKFSLYKCLF